MTADGGWHDSAICVTAGLEERVEGRWKTTRRPPGPYPGGLRRRSLGRARGKPGCSPPDWLPAAVLNPSYPRRRAGIRTDAVAVAGLEPHYRRVKSPANGMDRPS